MKNGARILFTIACAFLGAAGLWMSAISVRGAAAEDPQRSGLDDARAKAREKLDRESGLPSGPQKAPAPGVGASGAEGEKGAPKGGEPQGKTGTTVEADLEAERARLRGEAGGVPESPESFTDDEERSVGEAAARAILARFKTVKADDAACVYVRRVGALLVEHGARPGVPYRFVVVEAEQVNAFSAPYGYVFVTTGALRFAANEGELAFILAHEIAHVERRHGLAMLIKGRLDTWKRGMRARLDELSRPLEGDSKKTFEELQTEMDRLSDMVLKAQGLPQEREADGYALCLIRRAGYDPSAAVGFIERLSRAKPPGEGKPAIFATHPPSSERLSAARDMVSELPGGGALPVKRFLDATAKLR